VVKECFSIKKSSLDVLEEIGDALGMTKEEILNKIIERPESGKILLEAMRAQFV